MEQEKISHEVIQNELNHLQKDVEELKENQRKMMSELSRYKGMVGGVMLAISAITALISIGLQYFKTKA